MTYPGSSAHSRAPFGPTTPVEPAVSTNETLGVQLAAAVEGLDSIVVATSALSGVTYIQGVVPVIFVSAFCAANTVLLGLVLRIVMQKKQRRHKPSQILALVTIILYVSSCIYWALSLENLSKYLGTVSSQLDRSLGLVSCMREQLRNVTTPTQDCRASIHSPAAKLNSDAHVVAVKYCAWSVSINVNVLLADAVVCWRAWALWPNRAIRASAMILLLATCVLGVIDTHRTCTYNHDAEAHSVKPVFGHRVPVELIDDVIVRPLFTCTLFGAMAAALSLLTNVSATSLIAYKAWTHRRFIQKHLGRLPKRTQVEQILALLVETGFVYCIIQFLFIVLGFEDVRGESQKFASEDTATAFAIFVWSCLVPLTGTYPICVILLVALKKSHCDTDFMYQGSSGLELPSDMASRTLEFRTGESTQSELSTV